VPKAKKKRPLFGERFSAWPVGAEEDQRAINLQAASWFHERAKVFLRTCPIPAKVNLRLTPAVGATTGRGRVLVHRKDQARPIHTEEGCSP
jgi:hypothetical protein